MFAFVIPAPSGSDAADQSLPPRTFGPELSLTIRPLPDEGLMKMFRRLADSLQGAPIFNLLIFGSSSASAPAADAMKRTFGKARWPVTWVDGGACDGSPIAGIQVSALTGGAVQPIWLAGRVVGSVFQDASARHCLLGGLGPARPSSSREDQTKQTLEQLETALAQAAFSIADTVRTWFYLDDILSWYEQFNRERTWIYSGVKFRSGSLPASTGIGARNPAGTALTVAARAMQPLNPSACALEIASPLQCPAPAYGSSFSRAMELSTAAGRRLFISGTASVAPGGETLWQNDIARQVDLTMKVVEALLSSRGYSFDDLTRAVAYFKHSEYLPAFTQWCAARRLSSLPLVSTHCAICRDTLAFELEADAEKPA